MEGQCLQREETRNADVRFLVLLARQSDVTSGTNGTN